MNRPIRVVLVDDYPLLREGTAASLQRASGITVVGLAADGATALRLAEREQPDVVLLDLRLPDVNGVEVARQLRARFPSVAVLILTGYEDTGYVRPLLELGVAGYLRKTASGDEVIAAVRAVAVGRRTLPPDLLAEVDDASQYESLAPREQEILELISAGMRNAEIAAALSISVKTVEFHVSHLFSKLDVRSRTEAMRVAQQIGLLLDRP